MPKPRKLPEPYGGAKPRTENQAWAVAKHYIYQQGYQLPEFHFDGPNWKPEDRYLTNEGYPLGTTCWWVLIEMAGERPIICADTFVDAIWSAHEWIVREIERDKTDA